MCFDKHAFFVCKFATCDRVAACALLAISNVAHRGMQGKKICMKINGGL